MSRPKFTAAIADRQHMEYIGLKKDHVFSEKQQECLDNLKAKVSFWYPRLISLPVSLTKLAQCVIEGYPIFLPTPKAQSSNSKNLSGSDAWDAWVALTSAQKQHHGSKASDEANFGYVFGSPARFILPDRKFLVQFRMVMSMAHDINEAVTRLMKSLGLAYRPGWNTTNNNIGRLRLKMEKYAKEKRYSENKEHKKQKDNSALHKQVATLERDIRYAKACLPPFSRTLYMQEHNLSKSNRKLSLRKVDAGGILSTIPNTFEARVAVKQVRRVLALEARLRKMTTHRRESGPLSSLLG